MIYRETNPPLGLMSKASIFHAPAETLNSDRDERRLAVIGNAVVPDVRPRSRSVEVSGRTTDTPSLKISNALALPI